MKAESEKKIIRTYKLTNETIEKLKAIAKNDKRSMGNMIEILIEKEFARINQQ